MSAFFTDCNSEANAITEANLLAQKIKNVLGNDIEICMQQVVPTVWSRHDCNCFFLINN